MQWVNCSSRHHLLEKSRPRVRRAVWMKAQQGSLRGTNNVQQTETGSDLQIL